MKDKYNKEREILTEIFAEILEPDENIKEPSNIKKKLMEDRKILSIPEALTDAQIVDICKE